MMFEVDVGSFYLVSLALSVAYLVWWFLVTE